jgi:hypothetical protein
MTHGTAHTIAGFAVDGIVIAATAAIQLAEVNQLLAIAAASVSLLTAVVRLVLLIRNGEKHDEKKGGSDAAE